MVKQHEIVANYVTPGSMQDRVSGLQPNLLSPSPLSLVTGYNGLQYS